MGLDIQALELSRMRAVGLVSVRKTYSPTLPLESQWAEACRAVKAVGAGPFLPHPVWKEGLSLHIAGLQIISRSNEREECGPCSIT